jgi:hypothetical protein
MITFSICCRHRLLQHTVGAEGVSLEFRHISSYLLWYAVHWPSATHLLHLTILCIGYFAARHHDNQVGIRAQCFVTEFRLNPLDFQMILQSGHMPSVLQQLCRLPFQYFSEKKLQAVLFPTLLACCHDNQSNRIILEKEMSYQVTTPVSCSKNSSHMSSSGRCWTISSTLKMDVAFTWSKSFWVPKIRSEDDFC